ncbi:M56 family metallopeptidase [Paenibacillus allorhizosphaerae]|uniref:Peptidase M56 domain-containing protein n=1 Tax=Paenibacillus allorhizosphaerae TaxID=2849866 RepID=A0ABM8VR41_9BACL|nr:M56 family metallopeptidase [Paenibacillus allorhizosphaerae]CAG7654928.1 hypothetical protein PAECIP111802_05939 [Paenibacillus allorhizosphaerae]
MNRTIELLTNLFHWIVSVSAMAAVTVALILLMQRILHKRMKPRWQYLLWLLVVVRLILPWGPESEISIFNWISYPDPVHEIEPAAQEAANEGLVHSESAKDIFYRYVLYIWLLGIGVFGTYAIVVHRTFSLQMSKETDAITDAGVIQLFAQCRKRMSVHKPIMLLVSDRIAVPTLCGWMRPRLIMPRTVLNGLKPEQLRHIFLHELAHCKRNDIGINWLMQVLLIIHWFNPILWYAYLRMREDQELASDALALSYLEADQRDKYGYTLIQLLENYVRPLSVPGNVHLSGSKLQLKRRIMMIKQFQTNSYRYSFVGLAAILLISGCSLTNAKVDTNRAQLSNTATVDQKTIATADTNSAAKESDTKSQSESVPAPGGTGAAGTSPVLDAPSAPESKPAQATLPAAEPKQVPVAPSASESKPTQAKPVPLPVAPSSPESKPAPAAPTPVVPKLEPNGPLPAVPKPAPTTPPVAEPKLEPKPTQAAPTAKQSS